MKVLVTSCVLAASTLLSACDPAARCANGIESADKAIDKARDAKDGVAKLSPALIKAQALLAAAETQRIAKNYEGCMAKVEDAQAAIADAKK